MDFTVSTYRKLLDTLSDQGFSFFTFEGFTASSTGPIIILRQDVDLLPENSLLFAKLQAEKGIKGTYFFRMIPDNNNENIIKEISSMGHEIGYHYEDMSFAWARLKAQGEGHSALGEDLEKNLAQIAIESFAANLKRLREIAPVTTICMHGSPLSRWDSRLLWKYFDYHDFGVIGEPYFDLDFNEVLYLTDTGRRWDGEAVSVRDKVGYKVENSANARQRDEETKGLGDKSLSPSVPQSNSHSYKFHSTFDIIRAAEEGRLPDKIMMTFHPQRWSDKTLPWMKELASQNIKNAAKYFLIKAAWHNE